MINGHPNVRARGLDSPARSARARNRCFRARPRSAPAAPAGCRDAACAAAARPRRRVTPPAARPASPAHAYGKPWSVRRRSVAEVRPPDRRGPKSSRPAPRGRHPGRSPRPTPPAGRVRPVHVLPAVTGSTAHGGQCACLLVRPPRQSTTPVARGTVRSAPFGWSSGSVSGTGRERIRSRGSPSSSLEGGRPLPDRVRQAEIHGRRRSSPTTPDNGGADGTAAPGVLRQRASASGSGRGSSSRSRVKVRPSARGMGSLPVPYLWVCAAM